jgi:hypothetical protein
MKGVAFFCQMVAFRKPDNTMVQDLTKSRSYRLPLGTEIPRANQHFFDLVKLREAIQEMLANDKGNQDLWD